jgi:manganese/iron transport system permease protein/iron/zinc/copper transport system permease protein
MITISAIIGAVGYLLGFWLAILFGASPGASIVVTMTMLFMVVLVIAPRYGLLADWMRRASTIPQEIREDVLGAIWRAENRQMSMRDLLQKVSSPNREIRSAINALIRQEYLSEDGNQIGLTEKGQREASRLVRAHRLWETYLTRTGTPQAEIHNKAHRLEHISDESIVDYLDDKLGHPLTDPHGSEIPEDVSMRRLDQQFKASLLREGDRAEICEIAGDASDFGLAVGEKVIAGVRARDGQTWTLKCGDRNIELNHAQADAIIVRLISV